MNNFLQQKLIERCINKNMNQMQIFEELKAQRSAFQKIMQYEADAFNRSVWKRSVMTVSAYGCSLGSSSDYVRESLKGMQSEILNQLSIKEMNNFFNSVYDGIAVAIPAAAEYLHFIVKAIRLTLKYTDSIEYVNPLNGMPIHIRVKKKARKELEYKVNGKKKRSVIISKTNETDNRKTASNAAPSIFHGIDAGILTLIVLESNSEIAMIHDSIGTHPNDIAEARTQVNKALIELAKGDKLKEIVEQIIKHVPEKYKEELLKQIPQQNTWENFEEDLFSNQYSWS